MKKLLPLFLIALFSVFVVSCTTDDDNYTQDTDTISSVYDIKNVNFTYDNNGYNIFRQFQVPLYSSDVVLIYRQSATANGNPVWELLPKTYYLSDGNEVDYTFDFTVNDITIYAGGTFDLTGSEFIRNQTFRVVVIPANFGRSANGINYENYDDVINYYNINDKVIKAL
ncbi:hypothetical protein [Faecalibacter macacae]|uniref:Uncharacterized protein n=1 Tax=Faecalibacter macacae TaxID=1859289 RepID=A0A3L9MCL0_9FLAO|nr:hypothetical protein [Faecalibacter macacae]RLZ10738.1 hypothetical protein EAH69_06230 [Faecalibacter macacae]